MTPAEAGQEYFREHKEAALVEVMWVAHRRYDDWPDQLAFYDGFRAARLHYDEYLKERKQEDR